MILDEISNQFVILVEMQSQKTSFFFGTHLSGENLEKQATLVCFKGAPFCREILPKTRLLVLNLMTSQRQRIYH